MIPQYLAVYGILKKGFALDLNKIPEATFVGPGIINGANLYRIGTGVGLRFVEDPNRVAKVEVYDIKPGLWSWLDMIEANGMAYTRKVVSTFVDVDHPLEGIQKLAFDTWVYEHSFPGMKYTRLIEDGNYTYEGRYDV